MKTNGMVFRGACVLPLLFVSLCTAQDLEFTTFEQELGTTDFSMVQDSTVEPLRFHRHIDHGRSPFWFASTEMLLLDVTATTGGRITASFDDNGTASSSKY